jgi:glycosyltransferase involved in cell wall biosynthesis
LAVKIVQVAHGFTPRQISTIETYTFALCKELSRNQDVAVYARDADFSLPNYAESEETVRGLRVHRINNKLEFPHYYDYENRVITSSFRNFLSREKPDLVHFQHMMGLSASMVQAAGDFGVPVLMTLHDYWLLCRRMSLLRPNFEVCTGPGAKKCQDCRFRELERLMLPHLGRAALQLIPDTLSDDIARKAASRRFDGSDSWFDRYLTAHASRTRYLQMMMDRVDLFISPSEFVRKLFIEKGVPSRRIICVPLGLVDTSIGRVHKKSSEVVRLGYMGTVNWHKGVHVLVEAFNGLCGEPVELKVYGAAPSAAYLKYLRAINRNDKTKFLGMYSDASSALSEIDVLVIPSIYYESFSIVLREAFLTKTPVIASRIGALPEGIDDGRNGFLFEPGNVRDLLSKIRFLLANPSIIHEMSKRIPPVKTMQEHAREIEAIYRKL